VIAADSPTVESARTGPPRRFARRHHRFLVGPAVAALGLLPLVLMVPGSRAAFSGTTANGTDQWSLDALAAPDPLSCAWTGTNSLSLAWTKNTAWASGYDYERSDSSGSGYANLGSTVGASSLTGSDANPAPPTLRYYRVRAKSGANWTGPYSSVSATNSCDRTITTFHNYGAGSQPTGMAVNAAGDVYVSDTTSNEVYKTTSGGVTTTFAGTGTAGYSGDGGAATSAMLNGPRSIALDASGNLYIADSNNNRVRKVTPGGTITTVVGTGTAGFAGDGGAATSAQLNYVPGLSIDSTGVMYIADQANHRIRKVSGGTITTVAGNGTAGFSGDGGSPTAAQLSSPYEAVSDGSGTVYISDFGNNRIRKVSGGVITTVAGGGANGACTYSGTGTGASFNSLRRMAWDAGNARLTFAEPANNCIRYLSGSTVGEVAGTGTAAYTGDNGPAVAATLSGPLAVAFTSTGDLYISDANNNVVRKVLQP